MKCFTCGFKCRTSFWMKLAFSKGRKPEELQKRNEMTFHFKGFFLLLFFDFYCMHCIKWSHYDIFIHVDHVSPPCPIFLFSFPNTQHSPFSAHVIFHLNCECQRISVFVYTVRQFTYHDALQLYPFSCKQHKFIFLPGWIILCSVYTTLSFFLHPSVGTWAG